MGCKDPAERMGGGERSSKTGGWGVKDPKHPAVGCKGSSQALVDRVPKMVAVVSGWSAADMTGSNNHSGGVLRHK